MTIVNRNRFEDPAQQAAYEQGIERGELIGRFLGLAMKKDIENQELSIKNREHRYQATHDSLTGVLNLRGINEYLSNFDITNHVVLYADGTNIKAVNDKLGHAAGDRAIVGLADILKGALRKVDIVARIGGDEFLAILAPISRQGKLTPPEEQVEVVRSRIAELKEGLIAENPDFTACGFDIAIGASVGHPGLNIAELQASAEQRMEEDKLDQHRRLGAYR